MTHLRIMTGNYLPKFRRNLIPSLFLSSSRRRECTSIYFHL